MRFDAMSVGKRQMSRLPPVKLMLFQIIVCRIYLIKIVSRLKLLARLQLQYEHIRSEAECSASRGR